MMRPVLEWESEQIAPQIPGIKVYVLSAF